MKHIMADAILYVYSKTTQSSHKLILQQRQRHQYKTIRYTRHMNIEHQHQLAIWSHSDIGMKLLIIIICVDVSMLTSYDFQGKTSIYVGKMPATIEPRIYRRCTYSDWMLCEKGKCNRRMTNILDAEMFQDECASCPSKCCAFRIINN